MSNAELRFKKIKRVRDQQQKMADIETSLCKQRLDQAHLDLDQLEHEYQSISKEFEQSLNANIASAREIYQNLEQLQARIQVTKQDIVRFISEWERSLSHTLERRIDSEAITHLHIAAQEHAAKKRIHIHDLESQDSIMRQWLQRPTQD